MERSLSSWCLMVQAEEEEGVVIFRRRALVSGGITTPA
jgi:hypothetical protein